MKMCEVYEDYGNCLICSARVRLEDMDDSGVCHECLKERSELESDEDVDLDQDLDNEDNEFDCMLIECENCGIEYSNSMGHDCEEKDD